MKLKNFDRIVSTISPRLEGPTDPAIEAAASDAALDAVVDATPAKVEAAKAENASHGYQDGWSNDDIFDDALSLLATEAVEQVVPGYITVSVEVETAPTAQ